MGAILTQAPFALRNSEGSTKGCCIADPSDRHKQSASIAIRLDGTKPVAFPPITSLFSTGFAFYECAEPHAAICLLALSDHANGRDNLSARPELEPVDGQRIQCKGSLRLDTLDSQSDRAEVTGR